MDALPSWLIVWAPFLGLGLALLCALLLWACCAAAAMADDDLNRRH